MPPEYYHADTENGDHIADPSEDALFMLIADLDHGENTFVTITPADDDPAWFASVSLLDDGTFEVERRDTRRGEHELATQTVIADLAKELTVWLAGRNVSDQPTRSNSDF